MKLGHNVYQYHACSVPVPGLHCSYTIQAYTMGPGHNVYPAYHVLFPSLTWVLHNETGPHVFLQLHNPGHCVTVILRLGLGHNLRITVTQSRLTQ